MIYINFEKHRQNKAPRSNHSMLTRMPEVFPDTVMANNYNVLYLYGDRHSQSQNALFPCPKVILISRWQMGKQRYFTSFFSSLQQTWRKSVAS